MSTRFRTARRRDSVETFALAAALTTLGVLAFWWTVFLRRLSQELVSRTREFLTVTTADPATLADQIRAVDAAAGRRMLQIAGESTLFFVLLLISVGGLFVVARQRRRDKERMERVLAFTSHELNTPIAGVKALLQSLALGTLPPARQSILIERGLGECLRLEQLADHILAYQRAVGSNEGLSGQIEVNSVIRATLDRRAASTAVPNTAIAWTPSNNVMVQASEDGLRVILDNLLENAAKYGRSEKPVELNEASNQRSWTLTVRDYGIGFPAQAAAQLFEPFAREDRPEVTNERGSGLGLYIARQLAREMGGDLTARSAGHGHGAEFSLTLRRAN